MRLKIIPFLAGYITYTPKQELWKKSQSLEAQLEFRASFLDHKNSNLRNYTPPFRILLGGWGGWNYAGMRKTRKTQKNDRIIPHLA